MPCYYTGTREGDLELQAEEHGAELVALTRMLCSTIKNITKSHSSAHRDKFLLSKETQAWWKAHQARDKAHRKDAAVARRRPHR